MAVKVLWVFITDDLKTLLRRDSKERLILTMTEEDKSTTGEPYKVATFNNKHLDINTFNIYVSDGVREYYNIPEDEELKPDSLVLRPSIAIRGSKSTKDAETLARMIHDRRVNLGNAVVDSEEIQKYSQGLKDDNNFVILDDMLYVIMTEDKKCIVRGSKSSKFVLAKLDEQCGNFKVFTCRQSAVIVNAMNNQHRNKNVYLTDNVKELYNVDSTFFSTENMPKLIAVKAQTQYKIEL